MAEGAAWSEDQALAGAFAIEVPRRPEPARDRGVGVSPHPANVAATPRRMA